MDPDLSLAARSDWFHESSQKLGCMRSVEVPRVPADEPMLRLRPSFECSPHLLLSFGLKLEKVNAAGELNAETGRGKQMGS